MRNIITIFLVILSILACNSPVKNSIPKVVPNAEYNYDTLEGSYVGDFGGSDIRVILTHVTGIHAIGYDLLKGLRRNISGTMQQADSGFIFILNEPGDHPFDGKFTFTIDTTTFLLSGTWTPLNDKSLTAKKFNLKKIIDTGESNNWSSIVYTDSIGNLTFTKKGVCVYEFYPVIDGKSAEQLIRVKGTWSLKDSVYTVDWEKNTVFPARRSIFIHRRIDDSTGYIVADELIGEGRTLSVDEF